MYSQSRSARTTRISCSFAFLPYTPILSHFNNHPTTYDVWNRSLVHKIEKQHSIVLNKIQFKHFHFTSIVTFLCFSIIIKNENNKIENQFNVLFTNLKCIPLRSIVYSRKPIPNSIYQIIEMNTKHAQTKFVFKI